MTAAEIELPSYIADDRIWPALEKLAGCLCAQIAAAELPGLCFCGVVPGSQVALDQVIDTGLGQAWVRLVSVYPSSTFPTADTTALRSCTTFLAAQVEIGIMRCAPNPDGLEMPGETDQWLATRLQLADMRAMYRAVRCCFDTTPDMVLGEYNPYGPQGGVVGGSWLVWVGEAGAR